MAYVDWMIKTRRLASCNCYYGCPCEFNARPTFGQCEGVEAMEIVEGYFGSVRLDGLRVAGVYRWPGAVHEGHGSYLTIIDERATEEQREALVTILSGKEQEPFTAFNIYGSTIENDLGAVFAHIEFAWDMDNRTGGSSVADVFGLSLDAIRNPVTQARQRASIKLPEGFEYREAEMASADFWSTGVITQKYEKRYGFLTYVTYGPYGIIEEHSHPAGRA